jgi:flagellar basal-body rod modification protein FlgD
MTSVSSISATGTTALPAAATSTSTTDLATTQDRFLKLLVAQLNNQDPMNPMDNAAMTSQMAQINTVTGLQQVNDTLKNMSMLQSGSMVGHDILIAGNTLNINSGVVGGAIDLPSAANSVKVNILSPDQQVVGTVDLGAAAAGRQLFQWDASAYTGSVPLTFEVAATNGSTVLATTSLARDRVMSVGSDAGVMSVQLEGHNTVAYSAVKAIL